MKIKKCPCGSAKTYNSCCGIIHNDIFKANSPEELMRSRYSAYVLANIEFLMLSHHSSQRPENEKHEILNWTKSVKWKKLKVINSSSINQNGGNVEFKAYFKEGLFSKIIHENSKFVKENGHWVYLSSID